MVNDDKRVSGAQNTEELSDHAHTGCGPTDELERIRQEAPGLVAVLPVEDRGRHELIRLGAALAGHMPGEAGRSILNAAHALDIKIPAVEAVEKVQPGAGVLGRIEGRQVALGTEQFITSVVQFPHLAILEAGHRIAAQHALPLYVVVLDRPHCLGILGVASQTP